MICNPAWPEALTCTRFSGTLISMKRYKPVGTCIYCGSVDDLRDEHIIPKALNGDWILPAASCRVCEAITSKFEMKVLRGPLWPPRRALNLQSRHRDRQPDSSLCWLIKTISKNGERSL